MTTWRALDGWPGSALTMSLCDSLLQPGVYP